ncbi:unnamed protein product [Durusdinium trenchii]|uniref:alpha-1,3-mannosyl-glycoprotein 2-beta-N-acetylglucosaminyltransferase n=1 Tax=Durusdinium trenchii TaxID=1381693 RepID=A0ABP0LJV2_9DINO
MALNSRRRSFWNGSSFQALLIVLGAVLLAFMTALIGLYLALSDTENERTTVQRLRRAHSATLHAVERASRCLDSLSKQPDLGLFALTVSLDHEPSFAKMEATVRASSTGHQINVWKKPDDPKQKVPVAKIAAHFHFALLQSFEVAKYEFAIFIENDLILAPDFLWYFRLAAPLLDRDPSLWCVSSWNDNGFQEIVSDELRLFRTDYFPGLGWMIRNDTWVLLRPLWPSFPSTGWDHWLRHGVPELRSRDCVAPEVPRSKHVDTKGTNVKAGNGIFKLLEKMAFSKLPHGQLKEVSYLLRDSYEAHMQKLIQEAALVSNVDVLRLRSTAQSTHHYKIPYAREDFATVAKKLQLYPGQPRGARRGVILTQHPQSRVKIALVDRRQGRGLLPESELWLPDPAQEIKSGKPNESCNYICEEAGMKCVRQQLEFGNRCEVLKQFFKCENGCGHQVGRELPCYVQDKDRDTALQCLISDEASQPDCVFATLLSSTSFCGDSSGSTSKLDRLQQTSSQRLQQSTLSRQIGTKLLALPNQQEEVAAPIPADAAVVLLLHPGEGSPGFGEVPHMGSALTGGKPSWAQAAQQLVQRVRWDLGNEAVEFRSMSIAELCQANKSLHLEFILGVDLEREPPEECQDKIHEMLSRASSRMFITSSKDRNTCSFWSSETKVSGAGEEELSNPGPFGLQATLGGYQEAVKVRNDVIDLWHRRTAEEAVYAILLLIDSAVTSLPSMAAQRPVPTSETIGRAIDRCQDAFRNCFTQPRCLQSLACLSQCGLADQSCSYRCIVSYQSQAFTDFSLCALQKQNLLNSQIERPQTPRAKPLETFRGLSVGFSPNWCASIVCANQLRSTVLQPVNLAVFCSSPSR